MIDFLLGYLTLGMFLLSATLVTELTQASRLPPNPKGEPSRILVLAFSFLVSLWKWPVTLYLTASVYYQGRTLLGSITKLNQTRSQMIRSRRLPIRRWWTSKTETINGTAIKFYLFMSEFYKEDPENPKECRVTHVLVKIPKCKVAIGRYVNDDLILPSGIIQSVQQAKLRCEEDAEWLNLCAPARDNEKSIFLAKNTPIK